MANIIITPGAATDDAKQIDRIISEIQDDMNTLDKAINRNIPEGVHTTWSEQVKDNWDNYYRVDIPESMDAMHASAVNLQLAVEEALKYDK